MIGVFDSGVGGLTVLKTLKQRWPGEDFIYLADTARLPYGSKSPQTIRSYVQQNIQHLQKHPLKAIIVACNSASTAILDNPLEANVPIFNVVEPGARKAVQISKSRRIGVLGTRATVQSQAYSRAIARLNLEAEVFQIACPLFVPLVEEGWIDDPVTNLIVYRYLSALLPKNIDTLVLGCTHYPALKNSIQKVVGNGIELIDSSPGLIEDLRHLDLQEEGQGKIRILCTDFSPRLEQTIRLLLTDLNYDSLETIDL